MTQKPENKRVCVIIPPNTQKKLDHIKQKHHLNKSQAIRNGIDLIHKQLTEAPQ